MTVLASTAMLLAACGQSTNHASAPPPSQLPYPPAEFQTCFRGVVGVPDKALTVSEVEALWKIDRVRAAAEQRCGARFYAWYSDLQKNWR